MATKREDSEVTGPVLAAAAMEKLAAAVEKLATAIGTATALRVITPPAAGDETTKPAPSKPQKVDKATCKHERTEELAGEGGKKLLRCLDCGTVLDAPEQKDPPAKDAIVETPKKENGKKANPEELAEEMKKAVLGLAEKKSREAVIEVLKAFGVAKGSDVPIAKLPEFIAALKAANK
jgi:hypothetical protein